MCYSDNPITNIIHNYHSFRDSANSKEKNLNKRIEKLMDEKKLIVHPNEMDNFIKPLIELISDLNFSISIIYLTSLKSNVYKINFEDKRKAIIYKDKWGDLCISGKAVCEMDKNELNELINNWEKSDTDPQLPKEY